MNAFMMRARDGGHDEVAHEHLHGFVVLIQRRGLTLMTP